MNKENVSKKTFDEISECDCGKKVFKYHNTSKNIFVARCSNISDKLKKTNCSLYCTFNDFRPVFKDIQNKLIRKSTFIEDPSKALEEKLKILFKFLFVSNHSSTLDEINILVKNNLKREPRKTFYFPSIGHYNRISHYESFEDYEKRIFSKKIIDLNFIEPKEKEKPVYFIDPSLLPKFEQPQAPSTPPPVKPKVRKQIVKKIPSSFIIVSEDDKSEKYNSDSEQSEYDSSVKEDSDYEDKLSENFNDDEEIVISEDIYEYEDTTDYCDYNDDE